LTYPTTKPPLLTQELHEIVENDRYPFSLRIRTLRGILAKLRPEPVRKPLPPPKVYAAPRAALGRRRGRSIAHSLNIRPSKWSLRIACLIRY
jgi:hypothetical protein